jgi:hypothetical protein
MSTLYNLLPWMQLDCKVMRKLSYEWNPTKLLANLTYKSLTILEKSAYKEIIDLMWLTDNQYRMKLDYEHLAESTGMNKNEIIILVERLVSCTPPLLVEELSLEDACFYLQSTELLEQITAYNRLNESYLSTSMENRNPSKSIVTKIINTEMGTCEKKSIKHKDAHYQSWLPTCRFESIGQRFIISNELKRQLDEISSKCDVCAELTKMFNWLQRYPEKRKQLSEMNGFVFTWIRNSENGSFDSSSSIDSLDDEIEQLFSKMAV